MNDVVKNILAALKPYEAQIAKQAWESLIHPELLKLEGVITQEQLKTVIASLDAALDKYVEAEIAKI